jgi:hypothetical protein
MPHEGLQRPCIDSTGRQGVASCMPQHVSMDREWQLSGLATMIIKAVNSAHTITNAPMTARA